MVPDDYRWPAGSRPTGLESADDVSWAACFTTGTIVQAFLLARGTPADIWNGSGPVVPS